ncbi:MAG: hypothetical protein O3A00_08765 [Planctomycetota bacterium]|nr:hypothetical protein [Planctomycetota bacterium]
MPFQPLRFVHAAQVNLDEPLRDVGELNNELREVVLSATATAFQRVVDECIQRQVDFLLLTENSFCESSRSLKARLGLTGAFHRLHEHDIGVFVLAGARDPAQSWRAIPNLPDNVTIFSAESSEPVAVMRDGHVIATVTSVETAHIADSPAARRPFSIGLLPAESLHQYQPTKDANRFRSKWRTAGFDYLAIGAEHRESIDLTHTEFNDPSAAARSLAHSPGALQGLHSTQTGSCGASLIDVSVDGEIDCSMLTVAPVRRESISLTIAADATREHVVEQMQQAIDRLSTGDCEQAWLVNWQVAGDGPLWQALDDPTFRGGLLSENEIDVLVGLPMLQSLECVPPTRPDHAVIRELGTVADGSNPDGTPDTEAGLQVEYLDRLSEQAAVCRQWMEACLQQDARNSGTMVQLRSIIADLNVDDVISHAHRVGNRWLTKFAG